MIWTDEAREYFLSLPTNEKNALAVEIMREEMHSQVEISNLMEELFCTE
jgi:hypothetical protein